MAGGKQTPRQAMIGLMYLVLLAMLAMNASKSLLDAFVMLERGIDVTNVNFGIKNRYLYSKLNLAAQTNPAKAKPLYTKAIAIQKEADALFELIALHKTSLVSKGELKAFADTANGKLKQYYDEHGIPLAKDDQDFGATYFMVLEDGKKGKDLQAAINKFEANCVAIVKDNKALKSKVSQMLATHEHEHDGIKLPWISQLVEHLPLAAVTANLSNIQTYIRNAESEVVEYLLTQVDAGSIKFNAIEALAIPKSGYVLRGDSIKVTMFTAAYDDSQDPIVYLGYPDSAKFKNGECIVPVGDTKPPMLGSLTAEWNETPSTYQLVKTKYGKGEYGKKTASAGDKKLKGIIGIKTTEGTKYYMFKNNYMVAEPSATIAASKMNVLYVGVPNPMQISAPGVALQDISPAGAGISFSRGSKEGEYIANCGTANPKGTEISVNKKGGGKLGGSIFRIKRLPDPVASILGQKEGLVSKGKLKAASFLKAEMENFDFDVKVNVVSFKMTASLGGDLKEFSSNDNKLTGPMMSMLASVRGGDRIYFEDIKVAMPDKTTRKVPSIILKVQ